MIKFAICDDEPVMAQEIADQLSEYMNEEHITSYCVNSFSDGRSLLESGCDFDVIFLDIQMEQPNGLETAKILRQHKNHCLLIFVTVLKECVFDAFEVEALGYLVKPVNEQKFAEVFSRAQDKILSETEQKKKTLLIQYAGANKAIPLDHIYYMESQKHKVVLYTKDGELEYYAKIGELEEELQGQFCRIHKGYLVNLSCVDEYSRTEIMLANGDKLPLSKYKYEDFVKAYLRFMQ